MNNKDWNVDGSYVAAETEQDAKAEFRQMFGIDPSVVRPWTDEDQERLDLDTDDDDYFEAKYGHSKEDSIYA